MWSTSFRVKRNFNKLSSYFLIVGCNIDYFSIFFSAGRVWCERFAVKSQHEQADGGKGRFENPLSALSLQ